MPLDEVRTRVEEVLGFVALGRAHRQDAVGAVGRPAAPRGDRPRDGGQAARSLLYDEATTGLDPITATTVDEEIVKLRDLENVSSIVVTHQLRDAFFVATHEAVRDGGGEIEIAPADAEKIDEAEFIMLRDGVDRLRGHAGGAARVDRTRTSETFLS